MTARLMDLIVRYHELPKGEIVTKRDEIARELPSYWALSKQRVWDMLLDARTRLAEREAEIADAKRVGQLQMLDHLIAEIQVSDFVLHTEYGEISYTAIGEWLLTKRAALAATRKEPRNAE